MSASKAATMDVFVEYVRELMTVQTHLLANEPPKIYFYPIYSICHPSETSVLPILSLISKTVRGGDVIYSPKYIFGGWHPDYYTSETILPIIALMWRAKSLIVAAYSVCHPNIRIYWQKVCLISELHHPTLLHCHWFKAGSEVFYIFLRQTLKTTQINPNLKSCLLSKF